MIFFDLRPTRGTSILKSADRHGLQLATDSIGGVYSNFIDGDFICFVSIVRVPI